MILSLETATKICAVALHQDGELIAETRLAIEQAHSTRLTVLIEDLLRQAHANKKDLKAVAISAGPGSYTGLRIGVAVGKGLCFALQIPLLAVNTLEALAWQARQASTTITENTLFCPMLDARRMEVYCAIFDAHGNTTLPTEAKIIDKESFNTQLLQHPILFFGNGAMKCQPALQHQQHAHFIADILPTAHAVGVLAYPAFLAQQWEDLAYFEPFYLKDFVNNTKIIQPTQ